MMAMMAARISASPNVLDSLSTVTGPPRRIPTIHEGSGRVGNVKSVRPGIGTLIVSAIRSLKTSTTAAMRNAMTKPSDHGELVRKRRTTSTTRRTVARDKSGSCDSERAIDRANAQTHQLSEWRGFNCTITYRVVLVSLSLVRILESGSR